MAESKQHGALHTHALAGAQLVISGDGVEQPHLVYEVMFILVGIMWIERGVVEIDVGFGFEGMQQSLLHAELGGGRPLLVGLLWPVVRKIRDTDDDFLRGDLCQDLAQIFDKPILSADGTRRGGDPVLVKIQQHDGVAFLAEKFVIVGVVASGQLDHQLQTDGMEGRCELGGEFTEVRLGRIRNGLEVDHDAHLVGLDGILDDVANQMVAGVGVRQKLRHFADAPDLPIVIVEQAHDGKLDVCRFHPTMQLVVFEQRDRFGRTGFHGLVALVVDDGQRAVGSHGMQLLGDQDVEIFVVTLERCQAIGIPTDVIPGAQWIIARRHVAEVRDAAAAPLADRNNFRVGPEFQRAINRPGNRKQTRRKLHAGRDIDEEIGQEQGQQSSGNLHGATRATPSDALSVVENWSTFLHETFQPVELAGP